MSTRYFTCEPRNASKILYTFSILSREFFDKFLEEIRTDYIYKLLKKLHPTICNMFQVFTGVYYNDNWEKNRQFMYECIRCPVCIRYTVENVEI